MTTLRTVKEVVQELLNMKGGRQKDVTSLLWAWWSERNKANAGEPGVSVLEITRKARLLSAEIMQLTQGPDKTRVTSTDGRRRWIPPQGEVLKVNTDGAFMAKEKCGAWGFVIRDSEGHGVLAGAGHLRAVYDALSAEGEACLAALQAAMEAGISRVIIETDSLLVKAIRTSELDYGPGGVIFREIRELLSLYFSLESVVHVHRSCNQCAHESNSFWLVRGPGSTNHLV